MCSHQACKHPQHNTTSPVWDPSCPETFNYHQPIGGLHEDDLGITFQALARTNVKTVHQTSSLYIESNLDRLGLLSLIHDQSYEQQSRRITLQSVLINNPKFLKATRHAEIIWKVFISRSMADGGLELVKPALESASSRPKPCASLKNAPEILPVRHFLLALVGRKQTVVRDQLSRQKHSGSRFLWFSCTRIQHFSGSSKIELLYVLAEFGAYSPDRAFHGALARAAAPHQAFRDSAPLPFAWHHLPKGTNLDLGRGATGENHPQPTKPQARLNRPAESGRQPVDCISWGWVQPGTRRKDPPTLIPQNQVSEGEGAR